MEVKDLDRDESLELEDQLMVMLNEDKTRLSGGPFPSSGVTLR